jgi:hypothetical protein
MSETGELDSVNHWPPLYSIVIAAPIGAGLSATQSVRLVNAISFLLTLWLSGMLVLRLSGRSHTAALIAMAFIAASPAIVHNHLMTWSETIFIPLVLAGFLKMQDYFERGRALDLIVAAAWFGLATVDRYAGAAFVLAVGVLLMLRDWKTMSASRLAHVAVFGAIACIPTLLWFARNYFTTSRAHDRPFVPHLLGIDHIRAAVDAVTLWLLPNWVSLRMRALWLAIVVMLVVFAIRSIPKPERSRIAAELASTGRFWGLMGLSVAAYLGFVFVTILFFDFDVNFDVRMMSPLYVLIVIAAAVAGQKLLSLPWKRPAYALALALIVSFLLLAAYSVNHIGSSHRDAAQFGSARWTQASAWNALRSAPEGARIYSTWPDVGMYFANRGVREFPSNSDDAYQAKIDAVAGELNGRPAFLLCYPGLDDSNVAMDANARHALAPRMVDSTETVVLYELGAR